MKSTARSDIQLDLINNFPLGLLLIDEQLKIIHYNEKTVQLLSETKDSRISVKLMKPLINGINQLSLLELITENEISDFKNKFELFRNDKLEFDFKFRIQKKISNSQFRFFIHKKNVDFIFNSSFSWFYSVVLIPVEKETVIHEIEQNAEKLSSIGNITTRIAHEINNPLMIIQGCTDMIQKTITRNEIDTTRILKFTNRMTENINRMSQIITSLRSFTRDGKQDKFLKNSITALIDDSLSLCNTKFGLDNIKIDINKDLPANVPLEIYCRQTEIVDAFFHILSNSIHFIQSTKNPWIRITYESVDDKIRVRFTDSGKGIPKDIQKKMMEPFFTSHPVGGGLGLGLSFSQNIIEAHKGKLYYNEHCLNTEFIVEFPQVFEFDIGYCI